MQKVGFIGLDLMGGPMAANVARAGYPLIVYNRTAAKAKPLKERGVSINLLVAVQTVSLSEATVLALKGSLNLVLVGQIIAASGMASNLIERKVGNIMGNNYQPVFPPSTSTKTWV